MRPPQLRHRVPWYRTSGISGALACCRRDPPPGYRSHGALTPLKAGGFENLPPRKLYVTHLARRWTGTVEKPKQYLEVLPPGSRACGHREDLRRKLSWRLRGVGGQTGRLPRSCRSRHRKPESEFCPRRSTRSQCVMRPRRLHSREALSVLQQGAPPPRLRRSGLRCVDQEGEPSRRGLPPFLL